jgi:hypothetical protein
LISPSSGTFAAHFAGCLAGLITVYVPKMAKRGVGMRGRGRRLGGRYLRGDEHEGPVSRLVVSSGSGSSRPVGTSTGGGRRLGTRAEHEAGVDSANERPRDATRRTDRGGRVRRSIAKFLLAPFAALQRAAAEGAPLVVHAGFAVGCVVLQQVMARHAPGGILSTRVVRTLPLVLERSLLS